MSKRYAQTVLDREIAKILDTTRYNRFKVLWHASVRMGEIHADGALDSTDVQEKLIGAALARGWRSSEAHRIVRRGFGRGSDQPRPAGGSTPDQSRNTRRLVIHAWFEDVFSRPEQFSSLDLKVLTVIYRKSIETCKFKVNYSVRQLAEEAGCSVASVTRVARRLHGRVLYVQPAQLRGGPRSTLWSLNLAYSHPDVMAKPSLSERAFDKYHDENPLVGAGSLGVGKAMPEALRPDSDLWSGRHSAWLIFSKLWDAEEHVPAKLVAQATGKSLATVYRQLSFLMAEEIVVQVDGAYLVSRDAIEEQLAYEKKLTKQQIHNFQRAAWREYRLARMVTPKSAKV